MKNSPILIVAGEPFSIFIEIFLKTLKKIKVRKSIIIIVSKELFIKQMKKLNFHFKINLIDKNNINFSELSKKKINLIDTNFNFVKPFDKITNNSTPSYFSTYKVGDKRHRARVNKEELKSKLIFLLMIY